MARAPQSNDGHPDRSRRANRRPAFVVRSVCLPPFSTAMHRMWSCTSHTWIAFLLFADHQGDTPSKMWIWRPVCWQSPFAQAERSRRSMMAAAAEVVERAESIYELIGCFPCSLPMSHCPLIIIIYTPLSMCVFFSTDRDISARPRGTRQQVGALNGLPREKKI